MTRTAAVLVRIMSCAALISAAALGAAAQDAAPVSGPVVGFVFDRAAGIRPVLGVPGAATLGRPVLSRMGFETVVFPPAEDYALALTVRGRRAVLLRELNASGGLTELPLAWGAARLAISPGGGAAAFFYPETNAVAVLGGLPDAPSVSWSIELPQPDGGAGALAVNDAGDAVLFAASGGETPVWLLTSDAGPRVLTSVTSRPSLAFLPGSPDALVADGGTGLVTLVRDPKGEAVLAPIGGPAEGVTRPVGVAAAPDKRSVLVANAEPAGILSLSLEGGEPQTLSCDCVVSGLERLPGGAAFRVTGAESDLLWLLDAGGPPRLVFVPDSQADPRRAVSRPEPVRRGGER
ncbi:MAG: hypothetical protein IT159_09980 [Bryobacterales bacterium]|nr:hypothetical protein [Bryobacterales bacterium]